MKLRSTWQWSRSQKGKFMKVYIKNQDIDLGDINEVSRNLSINYFYKLKCSCE